MSIEQGPIALPAAAVADAKAFLRIEQTSEDGLVAALLGSAAELCEQFSRRALLLRDVAETLVASGAWTRLATSPVRAITTVESVSSSGPALVLAADRYAVDIDANGDGWVRILDPGVGRPMDEARVRITYAAGRAADWPDLPEALRHGIVRLAAHLYTHRDRADGAAAPGAVTALWRPWRRMRLG